MEQFINELSKHVNNMSFDYKKNTGKLSDKFYKEHRTIQSNIVRLLIGLLQDIGTHKLSGFTDPRNEQAINLCKEISKIDSYIPYI